MQDGAAGGLGRRAFTVLALTGMVIGGAESREPGVRLRGFTENLPPLNHEIDGEPAGFSVELLRLIAAETGLPLDIEVMPWPRAQQGASQTPASLLFSLTRTPERETQFQWVGPISPRRIMIYRLNQRTDIQLSSLHQLQGHRIGVVRDSAAARQLLADGLRPEEHLEWALDDESNLRKLLAGRMSLLLMLDWAAAWHLRRLQLPSDTLSAVLPHDTDKSYWYGLPPDSDPALVKRLQTALDRIRRDGRYAQLRQRYFA
ncbi:transporter substrate-binding domain-containing protein [Paucibacter sp. PLA-PC-4]|uniref:substrate-binding periplasmic protein n=1 Tax=Paucibacter sp. PLA-PC-4 TaxID=2993655 RepID=UPI0022491766|nr:transporter substrate-binding domain-containing protein [Paucibacter sp. PLA-PC-4]MCX2862360.1 transporter substrate-binding domain-containing protein [Paucibacter sp. PLA-PC-4]